MVRRSTVIVAFLLIAGLLSACSLGDQNRSAGAPGSAGSPLGPNVVLILLDDLDALTMPYWEAMPKTKARLAEKGRTFANFFVSSPECCPSRATILTGNYPHNTGVYDSTAPDGGYDAFVSGGAEKDTLATRLQEHGYHTSFVGKYLNGYEQRYDTVPPGWDDWFGVGAGFERGYDYDVNVDGKVRSYARYEEDYLTDVLSKRTQATLRQRERDDDTPFLLTVATTAPHDAIDAAPRDLGHPFADATLPHRPNWDEADVSDKPTWLRTGIRPINDEDDYDLTKRYRKMMGSLYAVDDLVDATLSTLERDGELDDTLVVFTSDNGYNFGAHRLAHKMAPYEESIRVPLVIAGPGIRRGTDRHLTLTNDLTPTILDLAGLPWRDLDGRSLEPLFAPADRRWRDDFLIEYHGTYHPLNSVDTLADVRNLAPMRANTKQGERPLAFVPTFRALRTEDHLYVEWYGGDEHEYELYDLDADPYELTNLVATPAGAARYRSTTDLLQARLEELAACSGASCRTDPEG